MDMPVIALSAIGVAHIRSVRIPCEGENSVGRQVKHLRVAAHFLLDGLEPGLA